MAKYTIEEATGQRGIGGRPRRQLRPNGTGTRWLAHRYDYLREQ
jgi:hypothetical protein